MDRLARDQISRAPESPGVYLLKGKKGSVLYIGKAKRLRARLRAYVAPGRDERPTVGLFAPQIANVEWILTDTEKEALLLENSLIKTHRPRYNVMLRDDKSYASLKLTNHPFPRLYVTRKISRDGSEYFGPYSSAVDLRQTLKLIQKIFKIRDCADPFFSNRSRPCLQYEIQRCTAPCVGWVTQDAYARQLHQARLFLKGDREGLVKELKLEMKKASDELRYEEAAVYRDRVDAVLSTLEPQRVESREHQGDSDAIGLAGDVEATLVKILKVRGGRMVGADEFLLDQPVKASAEILRAIVRERYLEAGFGGSLPHEVFVQMAIPDGALFAELVSERAGRKVKFRVPKKGRGLKLLRLARRNAEGALAERKRRSQRNEELLKELKESLNLTNVPQRIEGYDISNLFGEDPYGSMVVFVDGEPDKSRYRYYRIRTVKGANDFAMLREVFERRLRKLDDEDRPDLILVDGGKGQLNQLREVMKELKIEKIDLVSIAKEKELKSRSGKKFAPERLFLPGRKNAVVFVPSSPLLHLLQRVRDEAHRFGITRHRKTHGKRALESVLRRIPGIGGKRHRVLLKAFGSVENLGKASVEEIRAVRGLTLQSARAVFDFFRSASSSHEAE